VEWVRTVRTESSATAAVVAACVIQSMRETPRGVSFEGVLSSGVDLLIR